MKWNLAIKVGRRPVEALPDGASPRYEWFVAAFRGHGSTISIHSPPRVGYPRGSCRRALRRSAELWQVRGHSHLS
jgi:hypothetical protein